MASPQPQSTCSLLGRQPMCITSQLLATKMSVNQEKKSIFVYQQPFIQEVLLVRYRCCPLPHLPHKCPQCFHPCPPPWQFPCVWLYQCQDLAVLLMEADAGRASRWYRPGACCSGVVFHCAAAARSCSVGQVGGPLVCPVTWWPSRRSRHSHASKAAILIEREATADH